MWSRHGTEELRSRRFEGKTYCSLSVPAVTWIQKSQWHVCTTPNLLSAPESSSSPNTNSANLPHVLTHILKATRTLFHLNVDLKVDSALNMPCYGLPIPIQSTRGHSMHYNGGYKATIITDQKRRYNSGSYRVAFKCNHANNMNFEWYYCFNCPSAELLSSGFIFQHTETLASTPSPSRTKLCVRST